MAVISAPFTQLQNLIKEAANLRAECGHHLMDVHFYQQDRNWRAAIDSAEQLNMKARQLLGKLEQIKRLTATSHNTTKFIY